MIKAVADDGTILGWSAWGLVNLDGSRKSVHRSLSRARMLDLILAGPIGPCA